MIAIVLESDVRSRLHRTSSPTTAAALLQLLEMAGVGVALGVDSGQAGKRCVRLSYVSSERRTPSKWHGDWAIREVEKMDHHGVKVTIRIFMLAVLSATRGLPLCAA
jgi:hypothetical protein